MPIETLKERRDRFAAAALTGLLAGGANCYEYQQNAWEAMKHADALLAAIDKQVQP